MSFEIDFGKEIPVGFSIRSVKGPGMVEVCATEFVSSEDGDVLIARLEGISSMIFSRMKPGTLILPSTIDHLLAIVGPDGKATVYINELNLRAEMQPKRDLKKGEVVTPDDIADIKRMRPHLGDAPVEIPNDAGVVFLFSVGWRKGLYYDFSPLPPDGSPRKIDMEMLLGQRYAYLLFQERFKISDEEFRQMIEQRWFPFISLRNATIRKMLDHVRNGWPLDELLENIHGEVCERLMSQAKKWEKNPFFEPHFELLQRAAERYLAGDFISASSILWQRIEGVLRAYHVVMFPGKKATQTALVESAIRENPNLQHTNSLLLPRKFETYLREVFFEPFDENSPRNLSRNTVAHGVAPAKDFDKKGATVALLILEQLSYCLIPPEAANAD